MSIFSCKILRIYSRFLSKNNHEKKKVISTCINAEHLVLKLTWPIKKKEVWWPLTENCIFMFFNCPFHLSWLSSVNRYPKPSWKLLWIYVKFVSFSTENWCYFFCEIIYNNFFFRSSSFGDSWNIKIRDIPIKKKI